MTLELKDFLIIVVSVLLSCMITVIIMRKVFTPPHIATVDIQALIGRTSSRLGLQDLSEAELKAQVNAFTDRLKAELKRLALQNNLLILNAQGVLEGAQDLTPLIEDHLGDSK
ncbi:MAG: TrbI F-type domain-containing protein [Alphaproteobacteria bacterium]|nr:TrbI F-type domain-containing protein [Alphaproteobacteria bacterium]